MNIEQAWLSDPAVIGNPMKSSVVAQLPKDLVGAASIIVDNQMMIFGGCSFYQVPNPDIIIFNVDNYTISTLPSVFANMNFGQKTYLLPKGDFKMFYKKN